MRCSKYNIMELVSLWNMEKEGVSKTLVTQTLFTGHGAALNHQEDCVQKKDFLSVTMPELRKWSR